MVEWSSSSRVDSKITGGWATAMAFHFALCPFRLLEAKPKKHKCPGKKVLPGRVAPASNCIFGIVPAAPLSFVYR